MTAELSYHKEVVPLFNRFNLVFIICMLRFCNIDLLHPHKKCHLIRDITTHKREGVQNVVPNISLNIELELKRQVLETKVFS